MLDEMTAKDGSWTLKERSIEEMAGIHRSEQAGSGSGKVGILLQVTLEAVGRRCALAAAEPIEVPPRKEDNSHMNGWRGTGMPLGATGGDASGDFYPLDNEADLILCHM